ncbi:DUF5110 domain-containing protein [Acholeplasma sp. OttesenSCG-928-E16]|nr:DUF5110 domain-containing protein [Acholeplasma sp. OttesenSCG-928-E16]
MINDKYVLPEFKLNQNEIANKKYVFKGKKYRISLISERIFRFEYSESGVFYNSITKTVYNRNIKEFEFSKKEADGTLIIKTSYWTIYYKLDEKYNEESLKIESTDQSIIWNFNSQSANDSLFSSEGYVIIDDSDSAVFNSDSWFSAKNNKTTDVYFFGYQKDYLNGLKDFYLLSGNAPLLPRYAFGNWWSKKTDYSDQEIRKYIDDFANNKIPLSVFMLNERLDHQGFEMDLSKIKKPVKLLDEIHKQNIKIAQRIKPQDNINSSLSFYDEFKAMMDHKGDSYDFDVDDPKMVAAYFSLIIKKLEKSGIDCLLLSNDTAKKTKMKNLDTLFALEHLHYLYSIKDNKRGILLAPSTFLGSQRYAIKEINDSVVSYESLLKQIKDMLAFSNMGLSYISFDIGGSVKGIEDKELLARWVQFGVFSPILRLCSGNSLYQNREPWLYDAETDYILSHYLRLRHRLIPYIYTKSRNYSILGRPIVYPLYFNFPDDQNLAKVENEYFFGDELIIAPVTSKIIPNLNQAKSNIYLPEGNWYDFNSGKQYQGKKRFNYYSTLRDIPIFAKEGAIIPLAVLSKINQTDNAKEFDVHIFPNKDNEFLLYEDDGTTMNYQKNSFVETKINVSHNSNNNLEISFSSKGDLNLISEFRVYNIHLRSVEGRFKVDSMNLISEQYNKDNNTFIIRVVHEVKEDIKIIINGIKPAKNKPYQAEIKDLLLNTNYKTEIKELIGYYNNEGSSGLLKLDKADFIKELKKIKLDKELEEAIRSLV